MLTEVWCHSEEPPCVLNIRVEKVSRHTGSFVKFIRGRTVSTSDTCIHTHATYHLFFIYSSVFLVEMKVAQLCPVLCDPVDYTVRGILQTRILEWVAFPFSRGSSHPRFRTQISCIASGFFTSWALHCRRILHQLSQEGSPCFFSCLFINLVI